LTNIDGGFRHNKGGVGSRGYHIFRRGAKVTVEWGRIEFGSGGFIGRGRRLSGFTAFHPLKMLIT